MGFLTKHKGKKRPFNPPKFKQPKLNAPVKGLTYEPPVKKRKLNQSTPNRFFANGGNNKENKNRKSFKKPRRNSNESPLEFEKRKKEEMLNREGGPRTWSIFHCKRSNKKHKDWEDGILRKDGKYLYLYDKDNGRSITKTLWNNKYQQKMDKGEDFFFGSKQIQIDQEIENDEFDSGQCFNNNQISINTLNLPQRRSSVNKKFKIPTKRDKNGKQIDIKSEYNNKRSIKPISDPLRIKNPLVLNGKNLNKDYSPKNDKDGCDLRAVCVAKFLSEKLRPHQREGIIFLYECVMGIKNGIKHGYNQNGAILADEMGLGKTLQTIVLIYTLINDGPFRNPAIKKCIIVVPASLVGNWYKEFLKWISVNRRGKCIVIAMNDKRKQKRDNIIDGFCRFSDKNVLIIGYEMLRNYSDKLKKAKIGLIVCDEGHRLKNSKGNQTINALNKLQCDKRILLTGTPVQNELSELYAMCHYVNHGCLGDMNTFKNTYSKPIEKSRCANCSKTEKITGDKRSAALNNITSKFILRRTSEKILRKYLKPKDEYIIFHRLTSIQKELYRAILNTKSVKNMVNTGKTSNALVIMQKITFCCSSPKLAYRKLTGPSSNGSPNKAKLTLPSRFQQKFNTLTETEEKYSEKLMILLNLINESRKVGDKIVVVSNYTSILDMIEPIFMENNFKWLRIDGKVTGLARTKTVARFNKDGNNDEFIMLLSSKAAGVGLNLIGANRLIMLDPDWNPANDAQAMARIWRDGQQKKCKIYRFITIGSIEEKILQRQIQKMEVADSVVDRHGKAKHKHKDRHFTKEELKEIFTLKTDTDKCETVDIMKQSMKEWTVTTNKHLISTIIPMNYDKQIPVIFKRSVDPKSDPTEKWGIKIQEEYDVDNNDDDDDDIDSEEEYQLKEISDYEQDEDEEDDDDDESEIEIIHKKRRKKRRFSLDSDDEENENESPSRELRNKRQDNVDDKEKDTKKQQSIEEQLAEIRKNNQGDVTDLNMDIFDDFDSF